MKDDKGTSGWMFSNADVFCKLSGLGSLSSENELITLLGLNEPKSIVEIIHLTSSR
jgi:hypothetical protein